MLRYRPPNDVQSLEEIQIPRSVAELDLDGLHLKTLRGCPDGVRIIYVRNNSLESFEGLPTSVQVLAAKRNKVQDLSGIKHKLHNLSLINNPITDFTTLSHAPRTFAVGGKQLVSLKGLPDGCKTLSVIDSPIQNLVGLTPSIESLFLKCGNLGSLGLVEGLEQLRLIDSKLVDLDWLPTTLRTLNGNKVSNVMKATSQLNRWARNRSNRLVVNRWHDWWWGMYPSTVGGPPDANRYMDWVLAQHPEMLLSSD